MKGRKNKGKNMQWKGKANIHTLTYNENESEGNTNWSEEQVYTRKDKHMGRNVNERKSNVVEQKEGKANGM